MTQPAIELLVSSSASQGNTQTLGHRTNLTDSGLARATIARRLAALGPEVDADLSYVAWTIDIFQVSVFESAVSWG